LLISVAIIITHKLIAWYSLYYRVNNVTMLVALCNKYYYDNGHAYPGVREGVLDWRALGLLVPKYLNNPMRLILPNDVNRKNKRIIMEGYNYNAKIFSEKYAISYYYVVASGPEARDVIIIEDPYSMKDIKEFLVGYSDNSVGAKSKEEVIQIIAKTKKSH